METNADFATSKRIDLTRYRVERYATSRGTFCKGLSSESYELTFDIARIVETGEAGERVVVRNLHLAPSTLLCLPDRHIGADKATDAEIVLAIIGDESVYADD